MFITCPTCSQNFELPDSKVPDAPKFGVKCPSCRERIVVKGKNDVPAGPPETVFDGDETEEFVLLGGRTTIEPDIFPPGSRVVFSFVQSSAWNKTIESFFSDRGYYLGKAASVGEAVQKLRLNEYQVVIVDDRHSNRPVLKEIGTWPGKKRRWVNVILLGDGGKSMNPNDAFIRGINAYLNINDLDKAEELFDEILKGFEIHNELWSAVSEAGG
ncbi:MAG: zinc-ribbon domain-containing protein [Desulfovibrionales bacterium]